MRSWKNASTSAFSVPAATVAVGACRLTDSTWGPCTVVVTLDGPSADKIRYSRLPPPRSQAMNAVGPHPVVAFFARYPANGPWLATLTRNSRVVSSSFRIVCCCAAGGAIVGSTWPTLDATVGAVSNHSAAVDWYDLGVPATNQAA